VYYYCAVIPKYVLIKARVEHNTPSYLSLPSCSSSSFSIPTQFFLSSFSGLRVNLIMDTMGALALGTEAPSETLLHRKPYRRSASLISRPMWRNILCQSVFQIVLLLALLFKGAEFFGVPKGDFCVEYFRLNHEGTSTWDPVTGEGREALLVRGGRLCW
jgi:hypothetical protein